MSVLPCFSLILLVYKGIIRSFVICVYCYVIALFVMNGVIFLFGEYNMHVVMLHPKECVRSIYRAGTCKKLPPTGCGD